MEFNSSKEWLEKKLEVASDDCVGASTPQPKLNRIRAKMNVNAVKDVGSSVRFELGAVYSSRPDNENKLFSEATPSAFLSIDISKSALASKTEWLIPGAQIYVDLSLADIPEWNWSGDRIPSDDRKIEVRIETLDAESIVGKFIRETDEEFLRLAKNEYQYPKLVLEDDSRFNLYTRTRTWVGYYWKYVDTGL